MDKLDELLAQSRKNVMDHELALSPTFLEQLQSKNGTRAETERLNTGLPDADLHLPVKGEALNNSTSLKPKPGRSTRTKRLIAAGGAVVLAGLLVAGFNRPHLIDPGPKFNLLDNRAFSNEDDPIAKAVRLGYSQPVYQSATSNGITLTVGNICADGQELEFDMVESFDSNATSKPVFNDQDVHLDINGTRKLSGVSGGDFQEATHHRYAGVLYYPVMNDQPYQTLPTTFTLNVHIKQIGDVKGSWNFSIPVSWEKMNADMKVYHPDVQVSNAGRTLKVDEVDVGTTQTVIKGSWTAPAGIKPVNNLLDQVGVLITDGSGDGSGHFIVGQASASSKPITKDGQTTTEVTITSRAQLKDASQLCITPLQFNVSDRVPVTGALPVTMHIHPDEPVKVTGIEFKSDETLVHLEMDGAQYKQENTYQGVNLVGQYFLEYSTQKASYSVGSKQVIVDRKDPNAATVVFEHVDMNKPWTLGVNGEVPVPELALTVPLN